MCRSKHVRTVRNRGEKGVRRGRDAERRKRKRHGGDHAQSCSGSRRTMLHKVLGEFRTLVVGNAVLGRRPSGSARLALLDDANDAMSCVQAEGDVAERESGCQGAVSTEGQVGSYE